MPRALSFRPISRSSPISRLMRRPLFIITRVIRGPLGTGSGLDVALGSGAGSPGGPCWPSDIVVSRRIVGTMLAPHSAQKIVPSNCFDWQLEHACIVFHIRNRAILREL